MGHFNYHDKDAVGYAEDGGVKMNGYIIDAAECVDWNTGVELDCLTCKGVYYNNGEPDLERVYYVRVHYNSTNPRFRGDGEAIACVADKGEGINAEDLDMVFVAVNSGPYCGYSNQGYVQGNIQAHECDDY